MFQDDPDGASAALRPPVIDPDRHDHPLLGDPRLQHQIRQFGYGVVPDVLAPDVLGQLTALFDGTVASSAGPTWFTSGMLADPAERSAIFGRIGALVLPHVVEHFVPGATVISGHFHVNPPGASGGLGPHQDVALVDESTGFTLNGWIPLVDSTMANGCLQVVPGSHRFGNRDRSLTMPWAYHGLHSTFWDFAVPIEVAAGTLVVFDTALVHGSRPNESATARAAVSLLALPLNVPMIHLVTDDATPQGWLDVYEVPLDFYLEGRLDRRPPLGIGRHVSSKHVHLPATESDEVRRMCAEAHAELRSQLHS